MKKLKNILQKKALVATLAFAGLTSSGFCATPFNQNDAGTGVIVDFDSATLAPTTNAVNNFNFLEQTLMAVISNPNRGVLKSAINHNILCPKTINSGVSFLSSAGLGRLMNAVFGDTFTNKPSSFDQAVFTTIATSFAGASCNWTIGQVKQLVENDTSTTLTVDQKTAVKAQIDKWFPHYASPAFGISLPTTDFSRALNSAVTSSGVALAYDSQRLFDSQLKVKNNIIDVMKVIDRTYHKYVSAADIASHIILDHADVAALQYNFLVSLLNMDSFKTNSQSASIATAMQTYITTLKTGGTAVTPLSSWAVYSNPGFALTEFAGFAISPSVNQDDSDDIYEYLNVKIGELALNPSSFNYGNLINSLPNNLLVNATEVHKTAINNAGSTDANVLLGAKKFLAYVMAKAVSDSFPVSTTLTSGPVYAAVNAAILNVHGRSNFLGDEASFIMNAAQVVVNDVTSISKIVSEIANMTLIGVITDAFRQKIAAYVSDYLYDPANGLTTIANNTYLDAAAATLVNDNHSQTSVALDEVYEPIPDLGNQFLQVPNGQNTLDKAVAQVFKNSNAGRSEARHVFSHIAFNMASEVMAELPNSLK